MPRRGQLIDKVVLTGRVITPGVSQLGVATLGTVASVLVDAGSRVTSGQLLLRLDDTEQRAAVAQARAGITVASAQLGQVRQVSDRVATANLAEARAALEQAIRERERTERLVQAGAMSLREVDTARDAELSASSRVAAAEARASGTKGADAVLAGARVAEARAALELAEARLAQTSLVAPVSGTVLERRAEPGDIVQPGRVLFIVARDGALRLEAQSDEKNLRWFRPGISARAVADGLPGLPFDAKLEWISPAVDLERGTVTVRFSLPHAVPLLRPDMTVSINIELSRRAGALLVPLIAVMDSTSDHPWVLAVRGERTVRIPVLLGSRDSHDVEVRSGIDAKTVLVTATGIGSGKRVRASLHGGS